MNTEIKAVLQVVLDCIPLIKGLIEKHGIAELSPSLFKLLQDAPFAVKNIGQLKSDLAALTDVSGPADADLIAFVIENVPSVTEDTHAQNVVVEALKFVIQGVALAKTMKG